jgi:hypothetical protein
VRLILSGGTQLLYTVIIAADSRWPNVNLDQCQLYLPDQAIEVGNAGVSVKIGGSGLTTDNTDVNDILTEGDKKLITSQGGGGMNRVPLKTTYVRSSAANAILIVEPRLG